MSSSYVIHRENRRTHYLVPVGLAFEGRAVYIDASDDVKSAIKRDSQLGYEKTKGPNFGQAIMDAANYATYVASIPGLSEDNLFKFNTRKGYSVFVNALPTEAVATS